jgi:hypothetical protein
MHLSDYSDDALAAELERRKKVEALREEAAPLVEAAVAAQRTKAVFALRAMFPDVPNDPAPVCSGATFFWLPTKPAPEVLKFMNLLGGFNGQE